MLSWVRLFFMLGVLYGTLWSVESVAVTESTINEAQQKQLVMWPSAFTSG